MIFNKKAQGALEYLLLIGAAILIVAVVIVALSGIVVDTKDQNSVSDYNTQFERLEGLKKNPVEGDWSDSIASINSFKVNGVGGVINGQDIVVTLPSEGSVEELLVSYYAIGNVSPDPNEIDFELDKPVELKVTSKDGNTTKTYFVKIVHEEVSGGGSGGESGGGVIEDHFNWVELGSCSDLQNINNNLDANYVLTKDIDCAGVDFESIGKFNYNEDYEPDFSLSFRGVLDGNNFKIKNLKINKPNEDYVGLFSFTHDAVIKNLGLVDYNIIGQGGVGGLIGVNLGGKILNSYSDGDILSNNSYGGLVGLDSGGEYVKVYSLGDIKGGPYGGGLVGYLYLGDILGYYDNSIIKDSYSLANVSGSYSVGGFIGYVEVTGSAPFELYNNYFKGEVNSTGSGAGGLVGTLTNGLLKNNYVNANVTGGSSVGGLVGSSHDSIFENNYSIGSVSGNSYVGGLCGGFSDSSASNNFTTSKVISDKLTVGGLFGQVFNYGGVLALANNYFDEVLTGRSNCYVVNENGEFGYECNSSRDYNQQYFYKENAPLSSWTWKSGVLDGNWVVQEKNYPVLAWQNISEYIDVVPPAVQLISPQNGGVVHKFSATLKFNVYDSEKIDSCTINMGSLSHTLTNISSGDYEITFPIEEKNYDWNVSCTDWVGNVSQLKSSSFSMVQNTYQINDCVGLQNMKNDLSGEYTLMKDIVCSETKNLNGGLGFEPIGTIRHCELSSEEMDYVSEHKLWSAYSDQGICEYVGGIWHNNTVPFEGNFISNGKSITGLYINRPDFDGVGLFGITAPRVSLEGIRLVDFNVIGRYSVGGLVGKSQGPSILNNYVVGEVLGRETVGGLGGSLVGGEVNNNEAYVKVIGQGTSVGGLVGSVVNKKANFVGNNVSGEVRAVAYVGGIVGHSYSYNGLSSFVNNSFVGDVYGIGGTGGIVGEVYNSVNMIGNFASVGVHKG